MKDNDSAFWGIFEVSNKSVEIDLTSFCVPVSVITAVSESSTKENFLVIFPGPENVKKLFKEKRQFKKTHGFE